jgi:peptidoglycan/LPS O-acetylase OafA/YrhL
VVRHHIRTRLFRVRHASAEVLAGCCIALLAQCGWLPRVRRWASVMALLAILAVAVVQLPLIYEMVAMVMLGSVLVAGLAQHGLWPLTSIPARWLGQRSYAIYLWHPFMGAILFYQFHIVSSIGMLGCVLVMSLLVADVTYRCVERPLREVGRRIAIRPGTPMRLLAPRSRRLTVPEIDTPIEGVTQPGAAVP